MDLIRAACLMLVVLLHALMAGISMGPEGLRITSALDSWAGFDALTWVAQIMPLFFIVGGFASITQWRKLRHTDSRASGRYIRARIARLSRPSLWAFASIGAVMSVAALLGMPADLLAEFGFRMSQPLWFLAVYLGTSMLVPLMVRFHERAPLRTVLSLMAAVVLVDSLRILSGSEAWGLLNLAFVWLLLQHIGFFLADGWCERRSRVVLVLGIALPLLALCGLVHAGVYSPNMIVNLNPPTATLVLLGIAQLCALGLFRAKLAALAERDRVRVVVDAIGSRAMTIYLWHMPVLALVVGLAVLFTMGWPKPLEAAWWLSRPLWIFAIFALLVPVVAVFGRLEKTPRPSPDLPEKSGLYTLLAGATALPAVVLILVTGFSIGSALCASIGLAIALWASRDRPAPVARN